MKTTRNELKLRADKCPIKRFKAFIGKANTQATLCADTGIEIIGWSGFDASDLNAKSHRVDLARFIAAADPETIHALLAELEAKDKRIAELEQEPTIKHMRSVEEALILATDMVSALEAKLARFGDVRQHYLAGYDDGHSRGLNAGRLYKEDTGMVMHRHASANAYAVEGDE
ncbi:hypothetical protein ABH11_03231 [Serratia marcescens]|uniref:ead/Ea22-like family protein n=1 Tax=Serratia marcescens TaxID=615 RepID=UPI0006CB7B92|nr:ead/Ea22-like family protein [Serratia marcescens]ALE97532.1 hypothetical protein ABH11_03231 [Serratia marcescens]